jgi:hypothetical protein
MKFKTDFILPRPSLYSYGQITAMDLQNYIGGKFLEPLHKQYLTNTNPATGEAYGRIPRSGESDVKLGNRSGKGGFSGVERLACSGAKCVDVEGCG